MFQRLGEMRFQFFIDLAAGIISAEYVRDA
jgi:hypothetical protein